MVRSYSFDARSDARSDAHFDDHFDDRFDVHFDDPDETAAHTLPGAEEIEEDDLAAFDPLRHDRQARRKRKPKATHRPKKTAADILTEIADADGVERGFVTTYQPQLFEQGWLLDSLRAFFDSAVLTDILGKVKGGKEANVYRCAGHPSTGYALLAAKVYRPRMFRELSNDRMYREGREILNEAGRALKKTDQRAMRALGKKTAYGQQVAHTSWLMHEFTTLQRLHQLGAAVPQPIAASDNALVMSYHGDAVRGAPTLHEVELETAEAWQLFEVVLHNIELMLGEGLIHGDLSAYNILYEAGSLVLIDFPQVTFARSNSRAAQILERDITRVCEYFQRWGVRAQPRPLFKRLWQQYGAVDADILAADLSRRLAQEDEPMDAAE